MIETDAEIEKADVKLKKLATVLISFIKHTCN